jgi:hypothetical protein
MRHLLKQSKGQALIELIIFLPLMITLYSVISGFANSINGSINQQKITRAYFYNRLQNNSTFPGPPLVFESFESWSLFGVFFIGWKDYFKNEESPVMACYKVSIPFKNGPKDKCEEAYSQKKTLWVRVGTVYGACGTSLFQNGGEVFMVPDGDGPGFQAMSDKRSCVILQN